MSPFRITIHCSATKNGEPCPAATIRKWHVEQNGWDDIGYHAVIQPDGEIERGRGLNVEGAHVIGDNEGNIGVCLAGLDKFTREQWNSLRSFIDSVCQLYSIPPWEIFAHNQFPSAIKQGKTCPGISINRLLAWFIGHREDAIKPHLYVEPTGL